MKSSLFWEGPIVPILYVLQICVSESTELIAEVVTVAEKAEGFVPLRVGEVSFCQLHSGRHGDNLVLQGLHRLLAMSVGRTSSESYQAKLMFSLSPFCNTF